MYIISLCQTIGAVLKDFCSNTSIHGIRYFAERKRHWSERSTNAGVLFKITISILFLCIHRVFWVAFVILSIYFCSLSIQDVLMEWNENPVTLSLTEKPSPVSAIPFPAVTICASNKLHKSKFKKSAS